MDKQENIKIPYGANNGNNSSIRIGYGANDNINSNNSSISIGSGATSNQSDIYCAILITITVIGIVNMFFFSPTVSTPVVVERIIIA
uniref:Uncharacterized protein n=1 Tax=viral metagenome TaxID=1070528 RepID=A0A6C0JRX2_9ZZZZ